MTPFILKGAIKIPSEPAPSPEHIYDRSKQLWIDSMSGVPLVISSAGPDASRFGETTLTEAKEGVDQTDVHSIQASRFGETTMTKTVEGVDQGEVTTLAASRFGETILTATAEGVDQSEISSGRHLCFDAPHSHL